MVMGRANAHNTGIASEYYILSKLYRMELEAYISSGNTKAVDIRVIREDGTPISIDVKAVRAYSSVVVNNVTAREDHFIVICIYNNKFNDINVEPEIYVVPSMKIASITSSYKKEKRILKGNLKEYLNRWELLTNHKDGEV